MTRPYAASNGRTAASTSGTKRLILGGTAVVMALAVWQALWSAGTISPLFFTGPSAVVKRFVEEWTDGRLKQDMAYSGTNFVIGVGLAIVVGRRAAACSSAGTAAWRWSSSRS